MLQQPGFRFCLEDVGVLCHLAHGNIERSIVNKERL